MIRAMWLHYPDDPKAVATGDQYLWGRDLLVAPVVEKGAKSRRVYLPEGTWFDWWTGKKLEGKKWIEREVDLGTLPLIRARRRDRSARSGAAIHFPTSHRADVLADSSGGKQRVYS